MKGILVDLVLKALEAAYMDVVQSLFSVYVDNIITGTPNATGKFHIGLETAKDCYDHAVKHVKERGIV